MAGLILLVALIAFIAFLVWVSGLITSRLQIPVGWKVTLRALIVVAVFPLMVVDEIIGKHQFESLCKSYGIESVDISNLKGKHVTRDSSARRALTDVAIPMSSSEEVVREASTNQVLFKYQDYFANGGWLMRNTPLGMGHSRPMLFDGNGCGFLQKDRIFAEHQLTQIN